MRGGMFPFVLLPLSLGILVQAVAVRPQGSWMAIEQGSESQVLTPPPVIEIHGDRLSVRARNAPWEVVLQELARLTGARIRTEKPLPGTLTQEFEALPLEQGLRRLFREANYVFVYAKEGQDEAPIGKLTELWLLPKEGSATHGRQRSSPETAATESRPEADFTDKAAAAIPPERAANSESQSAVEELESADRLEALEASIREGEVEALQAALLDPDHRLQARARTALLSLATSEEPALRLQALSFLSETGQMADRTVLAAFEAATSDGDDSVKRYAFEALAGWGKPDAMEYLRQALHDPNPSTRAMVLESLAAQGQGLAQLQEALADQDETVRSIAAFWLQKVVPK